MVFLVRYIFHYPASNHHYNSHFCEGKFLIFLRQVIPLQWVERNKKILIWIFWDGIFYFLGWTKWIQNYWFEIIQQFRGRRLFILQILRNAIQIFLIERISFIPRNI